jgi:hypothetical protein
LEKEQLSYIPQEPIPIIIEKHHHHHYGQNHIGGPLNPYSGSILRGGPRCKSSSNSDAINMSHCGGIVNTANMCMFSSSANQAKDGCTVDGGHSSQRFTQVHMDIEEGYTTIKLVLKGLDQEKMIRRASQNPGRVVYGDQRSQPVLFGSTQESLVEDPRIATEREELVALELQLIAAKKAKLKAELEAIQNA